MPHCDRVGFRLRSLRANTSQADSNPSSHKVPVLTRGSLFISLVALLGCHAAQPAPGRQPLPAIEGFILKETFASAAPRLLSCNPPKEKPAPATAAGRWCYASDSLLLRFNRYDSLVQMQLNTLDYSHHALHNAESVWRRREATYRRMMSRAPDSVLLRTSAPFTVWRWSDPRGSKAKVLRACWLGRSTEAWYGNVWLLDEMEGPDTAITRGIVEVFAGTDIRPGCLIGAQKEP